jgi:hypothetical protein
MIQEMEAVISPAVYGQMANYHDMGLRSRVLTLPVMVAFVLGLIWQQVGSVREAVRVLHEEGMLWIDSIEGVTPQALLARMSRLPAELFYGVMMDCLPQMQARAIERQRPLPRAVAWARQHFHSIWAFDGSALDGLLKKCGLLEEKVGSVLAGKIGTLFDLVTQLPVHIWYDPYSQVYDTTFWPQIMGVVTAGCLLVLDRGLIDYAIFDQLTQGGAGFITRPKSTTKMKVSRVLSKTDTLHDLLIVLGSSGHQCSAPMRLIKIHFRGKCYSYLTNITDPAILSPECIIALYDQRWRIEDAFNTVKRLLGLAYFHSASINGIQLQVWATWLLYTLLVDLTDAVANALNCPFKDISIEMVFRGLYHFAHARHKDLAHDPIEYFARKAQSLDIIKAKRPKKRLSLVTQMELTIPLIP